MMHTSSWLVVAIGLLGAVIVSHWIALPAPTAQDLCEMQTRAAALLLPPEQARRCP
jgi:hypothetical protein